MRFIETKKSVCVLVRIIVLEIFTKRKEKTTVNIVVIFKVEVYYGTPVLHVIMVAVVIVKVVSIVEVVLV